MDDAFQDLEFRSAWIGMTVSTCRAKIFQAQLEGVSSEVLDLAWKILEDWEEFLNSL